jgi:hypothetical protein
MIKIRCYALLQKKVIDVGGTYNTREPVALWSISPASILKIPDREQVLFDHALL